MFQHAAIKYQQKLHFPRHVLQTCTIFQTIFAILSCTVPSSHTHAQNNVLQIFDAKLNSQEHQGLFQPLNSWMDLKNFLSLTSAYSTLHSMWPRAWGCVNHSSNSCYGNLLYITGNKNLSKTYTHIRYFHNVLKKYSGLNPSVYPHRSSNLHYTAAPSSLSPPLLIGMTHRQWAWQHRSPCCRSGAPETGGYRLCW